MSGAEGSSCLYGTSSAQDKEGAAIVMGEICVKSDLNSSEGDLKSSEGIQLTSNTTVELTHDLSVVVQSPLHSEQELYTSQLDVKCTSQIEAAMDHSHDLIFNQGDTRETLLTESSFPAKESGSASQPSSCTETAEAGMHSINQVISEISSSTIQPDIHPEQTDLTIQLNDHYMQSASSIQLTDYQAQPGSAIHPLCHQKYFDSDVQLTHIQETNDVEMLPSNNTEVADSGFQPPIDQQEPSDILSHSVDHQEPSTIYTQLVDDQKQMYGTSVQETTPAQKTSVQETTSTPVDCHLQLQQGFPASIAPVLLPGVLEVEERRGSTGCCLTQNSDQGLALSSSIFSGTFDMRYNISLKSVPKLRASTWSEFKETEDNFLRGCKWSPDGRYVLTNSNDNCLRIFSPFDNNTMHEFKDNKHMRSKLKMKECSQIYDFAWHPKMNSFQNEQCRVACTCSGIPIHVWDSSTGQIVANYRAVDQYDEITAAYSLGFSLDGSKLYAGYNKTIRIFDTDYPVHRCTVVKTYDSQRKEGQTGIISCFSFSPDGNGVYVAGSYSRHVGIYDTACDKLVCLMQGQQGGITHLMFSPDATKLYSGGRKDAEILCWDMRMMDKILFSALRDVRTNQRIYFDLSESGRYLVSGNNDGTVSFWDTLSPVEQIGGDSFLKPCSQFQAHGDCVNGISFNHRFNMLATSSGQRHFRSFDCDSSDSENGEDAIKQSSPPDFSLRLWQIPLS